MISCSTNPLPGMPTICCCVMGKQKSIALARPREVLWYYWKKRHPFLTGQQMDKIVDPTVLVMASIAASCIFMIVVIIVNGVLLCALEHGHVTIEIAKCEEEFVCAIKAAKFAAVCVCDSFLPKFAVIAWLQNEPVRNNQGIPELRFRFWFASNNGDWFRANHFFFKEKTAHFQNFSTRKCESIKEITLQMIRHACILASQNRIKFGNRHRPSKMFKEVPVIL